MTKSVSVIVPAHNAADSIEQVLSSLSSEAAFIREILVMDDSSIDGTGAIAAHAGEKFGLAVRVIPVACRDAGQARNIGIGHASAPLIYFLDADDRHCPGGLGSLVDQAAKSPRAGLIVGQYRRCVDGIDQPVKKVGGYRYAGVRNAERYLTGRVRSIAMGSALVTRAAIGDLRFPANLAYDEDTLFWAAVMRHAAVATVNKLVMTYMTSTKRADGRLADRPVAAFLAWRRALRDLAASGIGRDAIARREGLVAMRIAQIHHANNDFATAARFLTLARATPGSTLQTILRWRQTAKTAVRRRQARLATSEQKS